MLRNFHSGKKSSLMVVLIINEKNWPTALKRNNLKWEKWKNWNILRQTTTITTNIRA